MISTSSEKNLFDLLFDGNSAKSALDKCKDLLHTKICRNCGSVNEKNILYRCLTCGILEESCICAECFKNGNHEGHQYFACTCLTSFTCDCGNEKLWKPEGFCKYHGHQQDCDPIDLISNIYPNFINTTRDIYLHVGSVLNEQNNVNSVDIFFSALKEISSCDLFFVVMGTLLNENIPLDWKCELRTIVNEKNISFAEYFFEYIFLHPFESIPRCLWSFMTNFATEVDLFTFPLYRIYDMILLTAKQPFSNEKALDFVGQHFLISNDNATLELCNTHRLEDSLISLQNVLKQNMKEEIPITIARNAQNILFFFQTRLGPTPSVSPTLLKTYLNTLSICSNLFPNLIKEGEHASYDSPYFKRVSWAIFVGSLSDKLLLVFKPEYLQTHFLEIHEMVMEHIHTYLTDVPRISINETSFSYRVCGKNQPVSPSSPLITFYTKVLLQLIYSGYDITIPQQDAALLVESVLLSLCFKEQITNDVWKRNGDEVLYQHFFYVSLYTSDCLLYDLTLLQILVPLISPNTFALSLACCLDLFDSKKLFPKPQNNEVLTQQNTTTNGHSTEENEQVSQQLLRLLAGLADAQVVNDANQDDNDAPLIQQDGVDGIIARINEIVERLNEERYEDQQTVSSLLDDNTNQEKEVNEEQKVNKDIVVEMQFEEFIQSYLKYDTKAISSFLRIIVEICRNPILKNDISQNEVLEYYIIHMTAAGKTNPCDIYKSVPYRNLPFEEIYDKVCERKGKLKDNVLDLVNPVFPLLRNPTRESLLQNTLFQQKSIKQDRFYYKFDFPFDGSSLLHTSEFIYTLIACCLENYKEPSIVPFFLLFLSDAKQHVIFNEFVDEMLERIGIFIGKNHEEIYGYSECIKRVGGAIEKGFTSICCPQTQLHVKESQKLKRSLMLNKFKTMQQKFNFKDEQSDEEINSSTDSCVICQCITDSSIGRMISLTTNIAVEISREKEGGIVVSPLTISTCNHYIHYACYKEIFDSNKRECPICSKPFSYFVPLSTTIISHNNCLPLVEKDFERIIRKSQNSMNIFMDIIFSTLLGMEITQRHGFSIDPEDMDVVKSFFLAMKIFAPQDTDFEVFFEERKTRFDPLMFFIYAMAYQKDLDQVFLSNVNLIMAILCSSDSRFFSESIIPFMQSYKLKGLDECSTLEEAVQQLSKTFENCIKIFCECTGEIVDIPQVIDYIPRSTGIQFCITVPSVPSALKLIDLPPTFNEFVEIYSGSTCINCKQKIEEFFSIKVCLICGCCICSSPCCLKDHCAECSEGTGILFLSQTGSMCLTSQITRHIVVYENKYGEPFNSDSVQQSTFLLNTSKVEMFVINKRIN